MEKAVKAVVQNVFAEGPHGPYAVATSETLEGSVTFSLEPTVWREEDWPEAGNVVLLSKIRQKRAGWRAKAGRYYLPSDEQRARRMVMRLDQDIHFEVGGVPMQMKLDCSVLDWQSDYDNPWDSPPMYDWNQHDTWIITPKNECDVGPRFIGAIRKVCSKFGNMKACATQANADTNNNRDDYQYIALILPENWNGQNLKVLYEICPQAATQIAEFLGYLQYCGISEFRRSDGSLIDFETVRERSADDARAEHLRLVSQLLSPDRIQAVEEAVKRQEERTGQPVLVGLASITGGIPKLVEELGVPQDDLLKYWMPEEFLGIQE